MLAILYLQILEAAQGALGHSDQNRHILSVIENGNFGYMIRKRGVNFDLPYY